LFRPANATVPRKQQEDPGYGCRNPLLLCGSRTLPPEQKAEQDASTDVPRSREKQGREGLQPDSNCKKGASPDEVDGEKAAKDQKRGR
jgi:hypothetical protein